MRIYQWFWALLVILALPLQAEQKTPHETVDVITEELIELILQAKTYYDKDPERYYAAVEKLLDPLIDFPSFTRSVMGNYGTREYYQSLDSDQAKAEYRETYRRFVHVFKEGLINTYAKGLLAFSGQNIVVLPPSEEEKQLIENRKPVDVVQRISSDGDIYEVVYRMRPDGEGRWLLRNVLIESVNVGSLYRNQFASAMGKYNQDFSRVVDNWIDEIQQAEDEVQQQW